MTVRRIGIACAVVVLFAAALVGRSAGSASPASGVPRGLAAQQASPVTGSPVATSRAGAPTPSTVLDIPSPFECQVDEIDLLDLIGLADELGDEADLGPDPSRIDRENIRGGEQITPDDYQGILATTRELVACVNAEEPLRAAAFLSDRFLARLALDLLNGEGGIAELLEYLPALSEQVDPAQDFAMIPITAAWYPDLPDRTIFAIVEPQIEGLEEQRSFLVVFTYEDDRWLIDAMVLVE